MRIPKDSGPNASSKVEKETLPVKSVQSSKLREE
jgi:hypothetical protein